MLLAGTDWKHSYQQTLMYSNGDSHAILMRNSYTTAIVLE